MSIKLKALNFYIVIPAHNEQDSIGLTLDSLVRQTLLPKKIVVVNDNSTDRTQDIIESYTSKYSWIQLVNTKSSNEHLPGAKIINAFYKGFEVLDNDYDVICKFDADLIFPLNYLEQIALHFNSNEHLGMVSGFCFIERNGQWVLENLTNKDHIRGALKTYRKDCFIQIGKLKPSMGAGAYVDDFKTSDAPQFKGKSKKKKGKMAVAAYLSAKDKIKEAILAKLQESKGEYAKIEKQIADLKSKGKNAGDAEMQKLIKRRAELEKSKK
mgnify:CR=1 FL=1